MRNHYRPYRNQHHPIPMRKIIAQVAANNQLLIRYVNRPDCLPQKNPGDLTAQKRRSRVASMQQRIEDINKVLAHTCKEYQHMNYVDAHSRVYSSMSEVQKNADSNLNIVQSLALPACSLASEIQYTTIDDGSCCVVKESYYEITLRKKRILDIMKKSQRSQKKERCWGKPQTLKKFTRNAKQRILECGAVVDELCPKENTYELTLTIPGSGYEVYKVVSEWSGYIVNRMTQIMRRSKWVKHNPMWFFVWEHQKRGALHMHWCIAISKCNMLARKLCMALKDKWYSLLKELSQKTLIDLFKKKGSFGTWADTPTVWQWHCNVVTKSVAAYFSKYCSKTLATSKYNEKRRKSQARINCPSSSVERRGGVVSLCPSRYWGCSSLLKKECSNRRITISLNVSGIRESIEISKAIENWCNAVSNSVSKVSRSFKKIEPKTGFIYAQGWESKSWFNSETFSKVRDLFRYLHKYRRHLKDPIGGLLYLIEHQSDLM